MTATKADMFGVGAVETLLGLPKSQPGALPPGTKAAILGVPGVTPYASVGAYCAGGPTAIRAGIADDAQNRTHVDFDNGAPIFPDGETVVDCGDLPFDPQDFEANRKNVRAAVAELLRSGVTPILLGGDDSLPIPMLEAYAGHGPVTVLQIDAHIDWRDEVQGERLGLSSGMRRASEMAHVERIVQVGMRGIGSARQGEWDDARDWGAQIVTARAVARHGVAPVLDMIPEGSDVVIALDCDGLDPSIMPSVIARTPGGLGYWDVIELLDGVAGKARLVGFEMAEFVPGSDVDGLGALTAGRIIANVVRIAAWA